MGPTLPGEMTKSTAAREFVQLFFISLFTQLLAWLVACASHPGPVVVDFFVEPNEHVYPMVPAGKGLHEMELGTLA